MTRSVVVGIREWPRPGGLMKQFAKVVDIADTLQAEWPALPKRDGDRKKQK